jgi:hypothetical protein
MRTGMAAGARSSRPAASAGGQCAIVGYIVYWLQPVAVDGIHCGLCVAAVVYSARLVTGLESYVCSKATLWQHGMR